MRDKIRGLLKEPSTSSLSNVLQECLTETRTESFQSETKVDYTNLCKQSLHFIGVYGNPILIADLLQRNSAISAEVYLWKLMDRQICLMTEDDVTSFKWKNGADTEEDLMDEDVDDICIQYKVRDQH
ncbi:hypothetical protein BC937DRAFT_91830 [Endogone sp. FLAS-F59071]|nr:hypothetical protein BC937DRAFT_91830 [Endogone sp. FLAS-F59071]|eukprot:RUS21691.1 hypothetical protein BC937DRAFT_91830 [Endogone sp. FLAS-F59071]